MWVWPIIRALNRDTELASVPLGLLNTIKMKKPQVSTGPVIIPSDVHEGRV